MNKNNILQIINNNVFEEKIYNPRSKEELEEYLDEAFDKVWLMRSTPVDDEKIEARRISIVNQILETYNDIPKNGYNDWDYGFWNGVLGTLRWCLGAEGKDLLDT